MRRVRTESLGSVPCRRLTASGLLSKTYCRRPLFDRVFVLRVDPDGDLLLEIVSHERRLQPIDRDRTHFRAADRVRDHEAVIFARVRGSELDEQVQLAALILTIAVDAAVADHEERLLLAYARE